MPNENNMENEELINSNIPNNDTSNLEDEIEPIPEDKVTSEYLESIKESTPKMDEIEKPEPVDYSQPGQKEDPEDEDPNPNDLNNKVNENPPRIEKKLTLEESVDKVSDNIKTLLDTLHKVKLSFKTKREYLKTIKVIIQALHPDYILFDNALSVESIGFFSKVSYNPKLMVLKLKSELNNGKLHSYYSGVAFEIEDKKLFAIFEHKSFIIENLEDIKTVLQFLDLYDDVYPL